MKSGLANSSTPAWCVLWAAGLILLAASVGRPCCRYWWTVYTPIPSQGVSITKPTSGYGYACNSEVTCTLAGTPTDQDRRWDSELDVYTYPYDSFNHEDAYTWECQAGSWKDGDNTGRSVTWIAPNGPMTTCWIRCYLCDDAVIPAEECGNRDDTDPYVEVTVVVYKIACVKIEASDDINIYWPDPDDGEGTTSDVIWRVNQTTYEATGNIVETCVRKAVADKFPNSGTYSQTLSLARYPSCTTDQIPTTEWTFLGQSREGWNPAAFTVSCESCVDWVQYNADLTFKVTNGVNNTQTISGVEEFDVYGNYTCAQVQYTKEHLEDACGWGKGKATEPDIAEKVCKDINGAITVPDPDDPNQVFCICPGDGWSTAWDDHCWTDAHVGSDNSGMCCCRAHGMMLATQILGLGSPNQYTHVYVNELAEPGEKDENPPGGEYCSECNEICYRCSWWSEFWNNWEGACRSGGDGTTCYAPAGEFIGTYAEIRDDFGPYYWVWGNEQSDTCPHLAPP